MALLWKIQKTLDFARHGGSSISCPSKKHRMTEQNPWVTAIERHICFVYWQHRCLISMPLNHFGFHTTKLRVEIARWGAHPGPELPLNSPVGTEQSPWVPAIERHICFVYWQHRCLISMPLNHFGFHTTKPQAGSPCF